MPEFTPILQELDRLETIQRELAGISKRSDDRRRYDMIELRRQLAAQIAEVGKVSEPILTGLNRPELSQEYRGKYSKMRSAAAMHQANWPAVRLGEADGEFQRSAQSVREANRAFSQWMRDTITTIRAER